MGVTGARPRSLVLWVKNLVVALVLLLAACAGQPSASSSTSPPLIVDYGPAPAAVPLIYARDSKHASWYVGIDWTGKPRATVKLAQPLDQFTHLVQSPDGSAFYSDDRGVSYGPILDALGRPQPTFPLPAGLRQIVWADDNRHLCSMSFQNGTFVLSWHLSTYTQTVAVVGTGPNPESGLGNGMGIVGCAFETQPRAIVDRAQSLVATDYSVISLTDGRTLVHTSIGAGIGNDVVASHDARLIALNSLGSGSQGAAHTTVIDVTNGTSTTFDPSVDILAFSGDNRIAIATPHAWTSGFPTKLEGIDLATGRVLWRYDGGQELVTYLVQPGGENFALMLRTVSDQALHPEVHVLIEHPAGSATVVPGSYVSP